MYEIVIHNFFYLGVSNMSTDQKKVRHPKILR